MSKAKIVEFKGLKVTVDESEEDGKLVVFIDTPHEVETLASGSPDIRVWLNDALMYSEGEVGEDLVDGGE